MEDICHKKKLSVAQVTRAIVDFCRQQELALDFVNFHN